MNKYVGLKHLSAFAFTEYTAPGSVSVKSDSDYYFITQPLHNYIHTTGFIQRPLPPEKCNTEQKEKQV